MFDFNNSSELKDTSPSSRFENTVNFSNRKRGNFMRPPLPQLRSRMVLGRYPNTGFRPFTRPVFQPRLSMPKDMRMDYNTSSIPALGVNPTNAESPVFTNSEQNNSDNSWNIQYSYSPRSASMMNCNDQPTITSQDCRNTHMDDLDMSDLWVEALAPNGRIYYYNAKTRTTVWKKPTNCKIINLDENERLTSIPALVQTRNLTMNQCTDVRPLPISPYSNHVYPGQNNFFMPPRFFMFPPPTVCNMTQFISTPSIANLPNEINGYFNTIIPPVLSYPTITDNFVSNNRITNVEINNTFMAANINHMHKISPEHLKDSNEDGCKESKILDFSISDSKTSVCSSDSMNQVKKVIGENEDTVQKDYNELSKVKSEMYSKNENKEKCQSQDILSVDEVNQNPNEKENAPIDKSRPVSITPVSETQWCVVWTGDERVFFYDYQRKISVWERPIELLNRLDVDKLIKKPVLFMHEKSESTSNESDIGAKKLKNDDDNKDFLNLNKSTGDTKDDQKENKSVCQEIPHYQRVKLFRELLTENKVSAFSTWEKELHKIMFDPRYELLSSKEQKLVFDCYILEKIDDDKLDRQVKLNQQKAIFRTLHEEAGVIAKTRFGDFAMRYEEDTRFKTIEKIKQKEILFNQYVSEIIAKEKTSENLKLDAEKDFIKLLSEQNISNDITWSDLEKKISEDKRYKNIQSKSLKENIFKEYLQEHDEIFTFVGNKEERTNICIRNRENEVERDLSIHLKGREREQELHKRISAISDFKAMLNDLIKKMQILVGIQPENI